MSGWRIALWAAIVLAALLFLWAVRSVLVPFALAWIIAVILEPVVERISSVGFTRVFAILSIVTVFFALAIGAALWVGPRLGGQVAELQGSVQRLTAAIAEESRSENHFLRWNPEVLAEPPGPLSAVDGWLERAGPTLERVGLPSTRRSLYSEYIEPQREQIAQGISVFFNGFLRLLIGAASQLFLFIFVPIFVFLFLLDMDSIRTRWLAWVPPAMRPGVASLAGDVSEVFKKYLRGLLTNLTLYTTLFAVVFSILGLPYPLLLALLCGTLFLIPIVGGMFSAVFVGIIVGFSGGVGNWIFTIGNPWGYGIAIALLSWLLTSVYDMLMTPRVLGGAIGLHPLVSMFVVFSAGALFGLPGMILAFPVAGAVQVTLARMFNVTHHTGDGPRLSLPAVPFRHQEGGGA
ncbi:MAG: AI-2E family transporter [Fimbriimonadaceae bacterium]|nr:AI-2E family transporter [Fimbriimonadaceae bacterium]